MSYALELANVTKNFGKTAIIRGVNLAVNKGERVAVIGSKRPLMRLNSVLLPAPFGPMTATRSPLFTARLTPRMMAVLPKLLVTLASSNA